MNKIIYALGFFDGVHLGHQALLKACVELAETHHCVAGAVTFISHPESLVTGCAPALLNSNDDRRRLLSACGIRQILELPFDQRLMRTHWSAFLSELLDSGAAGFVCGYDFRFGAGGSGTAKKLAAFCEARGFPCIIVPEQQMDGVRVSSTHIRGLIEQGEVETAAAFLGHRHMLSGIVMPGRQLGRTIGVPTANVLIPEEVVVPRRGVYATECLVDGVRHKAVTNIGSRPTVEGHQVRAESWLLDFDGDLYGKHMTIIFHTFLRPEQKFASLEELKAQIELDARAAREVLR